MKQVIMNLAKKIGFDKIGHNIVFLYFFITALIFLNPHISLLITVLVAAFVELVYDKRWGKGTPELMDWVASILGPVYLYVIIMLFI